MDKSDEKIIELANQIVVELKNSGRNVGLEYIGKGYGSFDITINFLGTEHELLRVESIINNWRVEGKPMIKRF